MEALLLQPVDLEATLLPGVALWMTAESIETGEMIPPPVGAFFQFPSANSVYSSGGDYFQMTQRVIVYVCIPHSGSRTTVLGNLSPPFLILFVILLDKDRA
jgi:hypothetical protein